MKKAFELPPLLWGTKQRDVSARKALVQKFMDQDHDITKTEAERQMIVSVFRQHIRYMIDIKKIPAERLHRAIDETLVEDVQTS
jgi:hemoglobin-like flavoprotein